MSVIEALKELQEVDGRIRELEHELKDLPRRKALETARLSGVGADLLSAKASQEYANQRVRNYEADAQALRDKIQQLKTTQAGLKSNREYQQYSVQIDLISHELETTENVQLAAMDDIKPAEMRIAAAQAKFDEEKGGVDKFCAEMDERIARVKSDLEERKAERAEKARLVGNPQFMLYYERLRTKRWPVLVPLSHDTNTGNDVCGGCHLVQPPSVAQMADANVKLAEAGTPERIVACTMCGRILHR